MIAISARPVGRNWITISFASTLYLCPVLDLLLAEVPVHWQAELRLGLQEALVNAAKHGNKLDPSKTVGVRFSIVQNQYWWVISDEGTGFQAPCNCNLYTDDCDSDVADNCELPDVENECGRGLFILYQIFDRVEWNSQGTELRVCKQVPSSSSLPRWR
ncbi:MULTISPECIES: anti-sigma regulatory factor [Microcoleus]|uniref:Anti-sigma regulatory factor n=1 Tax=Microcoleus anatoxicus PTRS2 TaxID=2705321 RepID=A0ABU8YK26_9CYAN|nr:MAG: anti-sigma regulatory factor [Oscillatoriales cyanobacterium]TAD96761.1 MAG: anti-sigma regulatory factor [Oscillatoriales cyanobacterium]TAE04475.1 MAG: anti-sigma regulatory factor [Oscillatoriales cyanobacterium]TAF06558.1 MAG: anti-sigma regulatory factor [Oscillatoriales cyanobacterium]TAF44977.1 MAG: anti-sigma regulatory factor [Oscillatoriales cyanobacterium]